jgi:hypothetical protein
VELPEVEEGVAVDVKSGVGGGGGSATVGASPSRGFLLPLVERSGGRSFVMIAVGCLNNFVSDLQMMLNRKSEFTNYRGLRLVNLIKIWAFDVFAKTCLVAQWVICKRKSGVDPSPNSRPDSLENRKLGELSTLKVLRRCSEGQQQQRELLLTVLID